MKQLMKGFGMFEDDPFFKKPMSFGSMDSEGENMLKFSDSRLILIHSPPEYA